MRGYGLIQLYLLKPGVYQAYVPIKAAIEPKSDGEFLTHVNWITRKLWPIKDGWNLHRHIDTTDMYQLTLKHDTYDSEDFRSAIEWDKLGEPIVSGSKREVLKAFRIYARMI